MALSLANGLVVLDLVLFDNVRNWVSSQPILVTGHPVEIGGNVSDNAQALPLQLSFEGQITGSPRGIPNPTGIALATSWFERNTGQLITVTASAGIFSNMMITRWDYAKRRTGERWFVVTVREVRIASGVSVLIPPRLPNPAAAAGAASEAAGGVQPPIPVPPADVSALSALLSVAG